MSQPIWQRQPGGREYTLYVDTSGHYPPEIELHRGGLLYRFPIPKLTLLPGGHLVEYSDTHQQSGEPFSEWFSKYVPEVASYHGCDPGDMYEALCCEDAGTRAEVYTAIANHFGLLEFDQYPRDPNAGYHPCPCRDCCDTAIGSEEVEDDEGELVRVPSLCQDCEGAGCDYTGESGCERQEYEDEDEE